MKTIILTGGGSAGHVTPNLALIPELIKDGWEVHYIGTKDGIERSLINDSRVIYHCIKAGKLRRYANIKNITDPFRVIYGAFQAVSIVRKVKPRVIFSKGGFVSVPVVVGGWLNRIPVLIHESDITPGLANKIAAPFAARICINFQQAGKSFSPRKIAYTGTPIRKELMDGDFNRGLRLCGFTKDKPVIMVMGGSLGSRNINKLVREGLDELLKQYQVVHVCGKGNVEKNLEGLKGYKQFEYINREQPHIFKIAGVIVSRAGANSIFEFLKLRLPNILIPLSTSSSRGDQILNAEAFEKNGFSRMLPEESLDSKILHDAISEVYRNRHSYINNMNASNVPDGTYEIMKLIKKYGSKKR